MFCTAGLHYGVAVILQSSSPDGVRPFGEARELVRAFGG
jgi:hypothetical protein